MTAQSPNADFVERERAWMREASKTLTHCAGLVGSEAFTKVGDEYYADPAFCRQRCDEKFAMLRRLGERHAVLAPPQADHALVERLRLSISSGKHISGVYAMVTIADLETVCAALAAHPSLRETKDA